MVNFVLDEMLCSANLSFGMYPGPQPRRLSTRSSLHGTDELKRAYLPKLVDGSWTRHHVPDRAALRHGPRPDPHQGRCREADGSYTITGTKIFISAGEHDLTENIVHLVLARLPDAPPGTKGISLFLVPKFLPDDDGTLGRAQRRRAAASIEHKMGIKASATCVMNFDGAQGWLVGEPHKGMRAMFTMMNAARLGVGMQGLGLAEVALSERRRLCARAPAGPRRCTGAQGTGQAGRSDHRASRRPAHAADHEGAIPKAARALAYWIGAGRSTSRHVTPIRTRARRRPTTWWR